MYLKMSSTRCRPFFRPQCVNPDSAYPQIDVEHTSIRHFRVGSMSNRRLSDGLCYLYKLHEMCPEGLSLLPKMFSHWKQPVIQDVIQEFFLAVHAVETRPSLITSGSMLHIFVITIWKKPSNVTYNGHIFYIQGKYNIMIYSRSNCGYGWFDISGHIGLQRMKYSRTLKHLNKLLMKTYFKFRGPLSGLLCRLAHGICSWMTTKFE